MNKPKLDPSIEEFYSQGGERERLSLHKLEKDRTLMLLKKMLPPPPAVILDIGGAAGAYAFILAEMGYRVHLADPVPLHIEQAQENPLAAKLASAHVGDARKIDHKEGSADVVLFFGPLYHLPDEKDRIMALSEAYRVLKKNGLLMAVCISRFASFIDGMFKGDLYSKLEIVKKDLQTGCHSRESSKKFTSAYLQHPWEFKIELERSGFVEVSLHAVEGPVWQKTALEILQQDAKGWQEMLLLLEKIECEDTIIGASAHIMGACRK